jgi:hypothetical protein
MKKLIILIFFLMSINLYSHIAIYYCDKTDIYSYSNSSYDKTSIFTDAYNLNINKGGINPVCVEYS